MSTECETCRYKRCPDGGHCYMFRTKPEGDCTQHAVEITTVKPNCKHQNATASRSTTTTQQTNVCPDCGHVWTTWTPWRRTMNPESILALRDEQYRRDLQKIGSAIGFGNAQRILGELWDDMLESEYGAARTRGRMGVTVDDALPPLPKAKKLRREMQPNGGYRMVPAYTPEEVKQFAHLAIARATGAHP